MIAATRIGKNGRLKASLAVHFGDGLRLQLASLEQRKRALEEALRARSDRRNFGRELSPTKVVRSAFNERSTDG